MANSQKQDRVLKFLDEIKNAVTHHLSSKVAGVANEKTRFVQQIEHLKTEARKGDSHLPDVYTHAKAQVSPLLKRLPESASDEAKSALHKMDLAIHGRR